MPIIGVAKNDNKHVVYYDCTVSAIITTIALAIALGVRSSESSQTAQAPSPTPPDSEPSICLTRGCVQLAAEMTAAMNQSVDPCEDFYQFSCGNWGQRNMIPPGKLFPYSISLNYFLVSVQYIFL